jgi:FlaG/FlaF family flagellin (archaellin)
MALVTADEVRTLMNLTATQAPDAVVNAFITSADTVITEVYADDTEVSEALMTEIEKWYVAHMIASTVYRMTSEEKLGDASVKYTGKWDKGLDATPYGQMVKQLDFTGQISRLGKTAATIRAIKNFDD